jgi:outer membrane lipoprotein-sorting protein
MCAALAILSSPWAVRAGETLETVEKRLIGKSKEIRTLTADVLMSSGAPPERGGYKAESRGRYEFARKPGKTLLRVQMDSVITTVTDGQERQRKASLLRIEDGRFTYKLYEQNGQKRAFKSKAGDLLGPDPKVTFAALRKNQVISLLPDESLDGQAVYVIEARAKYPTEETGVSRLYFAKDTGTMLKIVSYAKDGRVTQTIQYSNIELNPKIDPQRFVFKVPEGVELTDKTEG